MKKIFKENYYSIDEVAELLEMSTSTIRNYIKTGKLSATKIGKALFVSQSNLKSYLQTPTDITRPKRKKEEGTSATTDGRFEVSKYNVEEGVQIWRIEDVANGFVILWKEGDFNGSQQIYTPCDGREYTAKEVARIMREIGDYLSKGFKDII